ncbi:MAG: hypothetical protein AB1411_04085 [Nitrospirota bacterium]
MTSFENRLPLAGGLALLLAACIPYKPTVSLEDSPQAIPVNVLVQTLRDATLPADREDPAEGGVSQTSLRMMEGEPGPLVTQAVFGGLHASGLFRSISRKEERPDLILSGTIRRFSGRVVLPAWVLTPVIGQIGHLVLGPTQEWIGEVDLEVTLSTPHGQVVGTYRGHAAYDELAEHDRRHWATPLYPAHQRLNEALTEAVRQVHDQMLADREKLVASTAR